MAKKTKKPAGRKTATTRKQKVRAMLTLVDYNGLAENQKLEVQGWLARRLHEIQTRPEQLAKRYVARYQLDQPENAQMAAAPAEPKA